MRGWKVAFMGVPFLAWLLAATGAGDAASGGPRVSSLVLDHVGSMVFQGTVDASCDAVGAEPGQGAMHGSVADGVFDKRHTEVEVASTPVDGNQTTARKMSTHATPFTTPPLSILPRADGLVTLHAAPTMDQVRSFEIRFQGPRLELGPLQADADSPERSYYVHGPNGPLAKDSHFPGHLRPATFEGAATARGDVVAYLRGVDVSSGPTTFTMEPWWREGTGSVSVGPASYRFVNLTDALMDAKGLSVELPTAAVGYCWDLRATLDGSLTLTGTSGTLWLPGGPVPLHGNALLLRGNFEVEDLVRQGGEEAGTARLVATGDIEVAGLDYEPVNPTPAAGAPQAMAQLGLLSLILLLVVAGFKSAGHLVGLFYSRFGPERVLDNAHRELVYHAVQNNPGLHITELSKLANLHLTTVAYHVRVLQRNHLVTILRRGRALHVMPGTTARDLASLPPDARTQFVLHELAAGPRRLGVLAAALAAQFGITRRMAYNVLRAAAESGHVRRLPGNEVALP